MQFSLNALGSVDSNLAGAQVQFGSVLAPIIYASATQINAIVPYEGIGPSGPPPLPSPPLFQVRVIYQGSASQVFLVPLATAAPGVFTVDSSGFGQAVAANQDSTLNSQSNPAPKGSYLTIYWTGGGQTIPAGTTGSVNPTTTLKLFSNVSASVGGQPVTVTFAGAAPGLVDGVCQLNIQLPANLPSGNALPLVVTVAGQPSPATATIAVQ